MVPKKKYRHGGKHGVVKSGSGMGAVRKEEELQEELRTSPIPKPKKKRRTVTKGGFDIEIDGKTYVVEGTLKEWLRKNDLVKRRKFKVTKRGAKGTPLGSINEKTKYNK